MHRACGLYNPGLLSFYLYPLAPEVASRRPRTLAIISRRDMIVSARRLTTGAGAGERTNAA